LGALTRAIRNVSRRKIRALLIIIALGFSMAIMISIPAGIVASQENYNSIVNNMQEETNKTATLIEVSNSSGRGMPSSMPSGMPTFGFGREETFINEIFVDEIRTIDHVKDVVPFLEVSSEETTEDTMNTPWGTRTISRPLYTIIGVCLNSSFIENYSILPTNITDESRNLHDGDSGVVLMSSNLTDYYGKKVGDEIVIYGESFKIVGIYEPATQSFMGTREVYMNISDAQRITGNTGNVSRLDVYAENVSYVEEIADVIKTYSGLYVTTYNDRMARYQTILNNAESTLSQTQTVATQEIIIAVAATSLIVLFTMLYTVRERTREIGILKAIGFSNWNVMSQFMLEGILISLIAGAVGVAIGSIGAPFLSSLLLPHISLFGGSQGRFQPGFASVSSDVTRSEIAVNMLNPQIILLAFGVAALLGALGSLYPAWRASRTSPMEALRYE